MFSSFSLARLPAPLTLLVQRASVTRQGGNAEPASRLVRNSWGEFKLTARPNGKELFDLKSDGLESINAANDEQHLPELNKMRELYESHLYEIKENAINDKYRIYTDLFDRKQTWQSKAKLLGGRKKAAKDK